MTIEAEPTSFENRCNCGGFAWQMNGREQSAPHMSWCPQAEEYANWWRKWGKAKARGDGIMGNNQLRKKPNESNN